ncbi:MAG TPA: YbaB/EbfC family nucleoid-associated protein [Actinocatenispora sp.]
MNPEIDDLLARVREQQAEVERIQKSVTELEVTGYSRNNEVTVKLRGSGRFTEISIDEDVARRLDATSLGDIVLEAVNDGLKRLGEASTAKFKPVLDAAGTDV